MEVDTTRTRKKYSVTKVNHHLDFRLRSRANFKQIKKAMTAETPPSLRVREVRENISTRLSVVLKRDTHRKIIAKALPPASGSSMAASCLPNLPKLLSEPPIGVLPSCDCSVEESRFCCTVLAGSKSAKIRDTSPVEINCGITTNKLWIPCDQNMSDTVDEKETKLIHNNDARLRLQSS